jgi:uncharacterized DUF497 family protein
MVFSRPTVPAARRALRTYIARNAARRHPLLNLLFVLAARCALRTYIAHAVAGLESGKAFDSGVATRQRVSALFKIPWLRCQTQRYTGGDGVRAGSGEGCREPSQAQGSFDEAVPCSAISSAPPYPIDHSGEELRYITVGRSNRERLIMVAHAERRGRIRIISARKLTRSERSAYEETWK